MHGCLVWRRTGLPRTAGSQYGGVIISISISISISRLLDCWHLASGIWHLAFICHLPSAILDYAAHKYHCKSISYERKLSGSLSSIALSVATSHVPWKSTFKKSETRKLKAASVSICHWSKLPNPVWGKSPLESPFSVTLWHSKLMQLTSLFAP